LKANGEGKKKIKIKKARRSFSFLLLVDSFVEEFENVVEAHDAHGLEFVIDNKQTMNVLGDENLNDFLQ
jgi:hypothetical protein